MRQLYLTLKALVEAGKQLLVSADRCWNFQHFPPGDTIAVALQMQFAPAPFPGQQPPESMGAAGFGGLPPGSHPPSAAPAQQPLMTFGQNLPVHDIHIS